MTTEVWQKMSSFRNKTTYYLHFEAKITFVAHFWDNDGWKVRIVFSFVTYESQKGRLKASNVGERYRDAESLFLSPRLLSFYSLRLRPAMYIWIWRTYFEMIHPQGSSNCSSVFRQAWKRADSIQSAMTREWRTQSLSFISASAAGSAVSTHAHRLVFQQQPCQMQNGPWKALNKSMAGWFMCPRSTIQRHSNAWGLFKRCPEGL